VPGATSTTAALWRECEKAITTSPRRNSAADITHQLSVAKDRARTPMRRNKVGGIVGHLARAALAVKHVRLSIHEKHKLIWR
jgi:hypothetical protein